MDIVAELFRYDTTRSYPCVRTLKMSSCPLEDESNVEGVILLDRSIAKMEAGFFGLLLSGMVIEMICCSILCWGILRDSEKGEEDYNKL